MVWLLLAAALAAVGVWRWRAAGKRIDRILAEERAATEHSDD